MESRTSTITTVEFESNMDKEKLKNYKRFSPSQVSNYLTQSEHIKNLLINSGYTETGHLVHEAAMALVAAEDKIKNYKETPHKNTCQQITIGSLHCDCRRGLCDCSDCIELRKNIANNA